MSLLDQSNGSQGTVSCASQRQSYSRPRIRGVQDDANNVHNQSPVTAQHRDNNSQLGRESNVSRNRIENQKSRESLEKFNGPSR
jgi:hypothetical protein